MTNQQINTLFLQRTSPAIVAQVLQTIAKHYGTDTGTIERELKGPEAENLLDYIPDAGTCQAASVAMQAQGLR